jgi:hypothetical protein
MTQNVELPDGTEKALEACSLAEVKEMANGVAPPSAFNKDLSPEAVFAKLAQEMETAGADTVADLGKDAVSGWESNLGLHFGTFDSVLKALKGSGPSSGK